MFNYYFPSFSDNGTCNKYILFAVMEARLSELEVWLHTMETQLLAAVVSQLPSSRKARVAE